MAPIEDPGADLPDEPEVPTANERTNVFAHRDNISKREMMMANWHELQAVARIHDLPCRNATIVTMPNIMQARKMVWDHYARKHLLIDDREGLDRFSLPVLNDFVTKHNLAVVPRMVQGTTQLTLLRDEIWAAYENGIVKVQKPPLGPTPDWIEGARLLQQAAASGGVDMHEAQPGDREDEAWLYVVKDGSNWIHLITADPKDVQRLLTGAFGSDMTVEYERWKKA